VPAAGVYGNAIVTMNALDALGSPVRRDILAALRHGPLSVGTLAERFPVSRPAISRHLKVLESAGLVAQSERGTANLYSVRVEGFRPVQSFLDSFWDVALDRLEALARASAPKKGRRES
jgi:DNA-binding transcriptional ArsR family regulator